MLAFPAVAYPDTGYYQVHVANHDFFSPQLTQTVSSAEDSDEGEAFVQPHRDNTTLIYSSRGFFRNKVTIDASTTGSSRVVFAGYERISPVFNFEIEEIEAALASGRVEVPLSLEDFDDFDRWLEQFS